jgi:hypothetical protein
MGVGRRLIESTVFDVATCLTDLCTNNDQRGLCMSKKKYPITYFVWTSIFQLIGVVAIIAIVLFGLVKCAL